MALVEGKDPSTKKGSILACRPICLSMCERPKKLSYYRLFKHKVRGDLIGQETTQTRGPQLAIKIGGFRPLMFLPERRSRIDPTGVELGIEQSNARASIVDHSQTFSSFNLNAGKHINLSIPNDIPNERQDLRFPTIHAHVYNLLCFHISATQHNVIALSTGSNNFSLKWRQQWIMAPVVDHPPFLKEQWAQQESNYIYILLCSGSRNGQNMGLKILIKVLFLSILVSYECYFQLVTGKHRIY